MTAKSRKLRLSHRTAAAARPKATEYVLWDSALPHFGVRVQPSGSRSWILQARAQGRMRKITLGRFPDMGIVEARKKAAAMIARLSAGEDIAPPRKAPLFREFAVCYRERSRNRWKPSTLKTYDTYMRHRLMPAFGRLRLDAIGHVRVSKWFDEASFDKPGAANRSFEILRAMFAAARKWGELDRNAPDPCANITMNPRKSVAYYLDHEELARLGAALAHREARCLWATTAIRLLLLTGARLSEIINLRRDAIGELSEDGAGARLKDSKTGPRTIWLSPDAVRLITELPRPKDDPQRVFPGELTSSRLYTFWCGVRQEIGLPGLRIHDCRHTWASQGVMNGIGLTTVGSLLGHSRQSTTAIYAHLDDATLQGAAAQAAGIIAEAMGYRYPDSTPAEAGPRNRRPDT